jgi:hypothetical protein
MLQSFDCRSMTMSDECDDADDPAECRADRARWKDTLHHGLRRGMDVIADRLMSGDAPAAAAEAASAGGTVGMDAAESVGAALEALPEVAVAALATGGKVSAGAARYARARAELEAIHRRLKKKHVGKVTGAEASHHAGRARRSAHSSGGAPGQPKPCWPSHVDTSRLERR